MRRVLLRVRVATRYKPIAVLTGKRARARVHVRKKEGEFFDGKEKDTHYTLARILAASAKVEVRIYFPWVYITCTWNYFTVMRLLFPRM